MIFNDVEETFMIRNEKEMEKEMKAKKNTNITT